MKAKRIALAVILGLCLVGAGACVTYLAISQFAVQREISSLEAAQLPSLPQELIADAGGDASSDDDAIKDVQVSNPIDFEALQEQNPDVCGWLYVPGTNVNRSVVQSPTDDAFYLDHDDAGAYSPTGALFMERCNSADFSDPVTVIYGHNWTEEVMFTQLHKFQDAEFFQDHQYIYVYAPGHIYTYQVISAFTWDNDHLLSGADYTDPDQLLAFEALISDPDSLSVQTREVEMDQDSKILVLSTCNSGVFVDTTRFLVCGVMVDDLATA